MLSYLKSLTMKLFQMLARQGEIYTKRYQHKHYFIAGILRPGCSDVPSRETHSLPL